MSNEKITCIACKMTPSQQRANRLSGWEGDYCTPGRCIVKGYVWRVMLTDLKPVDWDLNRVDEKIHQNYLEFADKKP